MKITNLKEEPSLFEKTISLIEKSFKYSKNFHFKTDFAPLVSEKNHENCFVAVIDNEVVGHIGYLEKDILIGKESFKIGLIGGIAVNEEKRGQGLFSELFSHVLSEKRDDIAFFVLWSDLEKLYKKFGFHLCGQQYELSETKGAQNFVKTKYEALNSEEKKQIQKLYAESFSSLYLTVKREESDWTKLSEITSADLYLKKNSQIDNYFFMNKGQDLTGIIYEYGKFDKEMTHYGKVWMGAPLLETETLQYQFFMAPAATKLFAQFVLAYTNQAVSIRDINLMKQEVYFDFNGETLSLETEDFLRGIFGPGIFEEFGEMRPFFISGLDSI